MNSKIIFQLLVLLFGVQSLFAAENPFAEIVRKSEPLTPEQQQKTFHLPPGFEIELVASEPEISKPMNIAFDAKGRLWLTQSPEYPFPVLPVEKKGRDKVVVLENFDAKGKAQKITPFVDGLNIPIGLMPYKKGVIAFTIPKVHFFEDTDGDSRADKDEVLLTGFGYQKDTHGLTSHFTRGYDGFVYADHGFNNDSEITAKDGSQLKVNSGNTYRFPPDGSHVEQFTWGQVNPFGLAFDPLGDLWASDCHSSAVYLLLRGGHYPSFGKPHDGLGFAPAIIGHSHGSTAIAGMVFYDDDKFPKEFWNNTFIGNVMTCRINRDSYSERGSTRVAKEEPDFLTSDDPWFRPVDIKLGPDGAIYVADFYNRIIGHYEVPLTHPGRDRERGRIWRIVYTGKNSSREANEDSKAKKSSEISESLKLPTDVKALIVELGNANISRRMLAMNWLVDEIGKPAVKPVEKMMRDKKSNASQKIHGLWILHRLGSLDEKILTTAAKDADRGVRVHAMRVLSETTKWDSPQYWLVRARLSDSDPYVQRAAADAIGLHPQFENIKPLLNVREKVSAEDSQLLHVVRMSLRNQLLQQENFDKLEKIQLSEADSRAIADVAAGIKSEQAGSFLLRHVQKFSETREKMSDSLRHATRYGRVSDMDTIAQFTRTKFADNIDFQLTLFKSVQEGLAQRGTKLTPGILDWGTELAETLLASVDVNTLEWRNSPIKKAESVNPWVLEKRPSADGNKNSQFISSLSPGGEKLTGILRSKSFTIPEKLSFFLAGHDGSPDRAKGKKNLIRLRDAKTQKVLMEEFPPRNDTAQPVTWDLSSHAGKNGYLEIVDGNSGHAYAWLAVGRFSPQVVPMPKIIPNQIDKRQIAAAEMAELLQLKKLEPQLADLLNNETVDAETRAASAKALMAINPSAHISELGKIISEIEAPISLREKSAQALAQVNSAIAKNILIEAIGNAPRSLQMEIARSLAGNAESAESLLQGVAEGKVSARLLQEQTVKDRLLAAKIPNFSERLDQLTKGLIPLDVARQKLIDERRVAFGSAESSTEQGAKIFTQSCAVCHQIDKQGALVGPQLDGVGARGADRLIEDILDPNRNVDRAFRTSLIVLKDGEVQSGLFRREEGETVVLAQSTGKEISIPKKDIQERRESETSLMPENFSDVISTEDFNHLIAFLLSKGSKPDSK